MFMSKVCWCLIIDIASIIPVSSKMFLISGAQESSWGGTTGPRRGAAYEKEGAGGPDWAAEARKGKSPWGCRPGESQVTIMPSWLPQSEGPNQDFKDDCLLCVDLKKNSQNCRNILHFDLQELDSILKRKTCLGFSVAWETWCFQMLWFKKKKCLIIVTGSSTRELGRRCRGHTWTWLLWSELLWTLGTVLSVQSR